MINRQDLQKTYVYHPKKGKSFERTILDIFFDDITGVFRVSYIIRKKRGDISFDEFLLWANKYACKIVKPKITYTEPVISTNKDIVMSTNLKVNDSNYRSRYHTKRRVQKDLAALGELHFMEPILNVLNFNPLDRTAVFIDGPAFYNALRSLDKEIDYVRLLGLFKTSSRLIQANYYTNIEEGSEFKALVPLTDFLSYNGYCVNTDAHDANGPLNNFVGMRVVTDMLALAATNHVDHIVLLGNQYFYAYPMQQLHDMGIKTSVISVKRNNRYMTSDKLRQAVDQFIDLTGLVDEIKRVR